MYVKKAFGYVLPPEHASAFVKGRLDTYSPPTTVSKKWKHWVAKLDLKTCLACRNLHGKIYDRNDTPLEELPLHPNCRCAVKAMQAVVAGNATKDGENGADWWISDSGLLPDYYISKKEISRLGWKWGKSPVKFAPGKMVTGGIYSNRNRHLPHAPGRIWWEADINYYSGRRNMHRLLWSNDGLLFVTYDHYETFLEIILEEERTMDENKSITLDLTGCKYLGELHERIRIAFDFPEWYGKNWDAFWDLLWSNCEAEMVEIVGEYTLSKEFLPELKLMHEVLQQSKFESKKYNGNFDYKIIS